MDETVAWLQGMGADVVTTPQDLKAALGEQTICICICRLGVLVFPSACLELLSQTTPCHQSYLGGTAKAGH
jgi:hypothetical protein